MIRVSGSNGRGARDLDARAVPAVIGGVFDAPATGFEITPDATP